MAKFKIQFVSANEVVGARLQIDKELRGIIAALGAQVDIPTTPAARLEDVIRALKDGKPKPDIVHFSAHGSPTGEIILLDGKDQPKPLSTAAFEQLFKVLKGNVRLVTLNACFSASQARKVAKHIDCVVGIEETIPDNVASASYTALLYEELTKGKSVKDAFEVSRIPILNARLPQKQQPKLITRKAVDPAKVFIGLAKRAVKSGKKRLAVRTAEGGRTSQPAPVSAQQSKQNSDSLLTKKQFHYDENEERYGVWAESLTLTKVCDEDGSSSLHYQLKNLQVRNCEVTGIRFAVESTAGLVGAPVSDQNAIDLAITWKDDPVPPRQTMDDVVEQARTLRGSFHFGQVLRPGSTAYTFGWTLKIFNNDALTAWEFYNLYSDKQQFHVDGNPLGGPMEYFTRLEWFPVKQLVLSLKLPRCIPARPRLRVFSMKGNPQMPKEEIIHNDTLWFLPRADTTWYKQNCKWELALAEQKNEHGALSCKGRQSTLTIDFPQLGSYYSLDWDLPKPPATFLMRQAEDVRDALLKHRENRMQNKIDVVSAHIAQWFRQLHETIWNEYSSKRPEDKIRTSLITYNKSELKLRVVEGRVNDADLEENSWQFWLPFGLGLAGHCLRSGNAVRYLRPLDVGDPEQPENYLPVPGTTDYECLIAFPIDHPKLTAKMAKDSDLPRGRQLVGVLTIGSTFRASKLYHLIESKVEELKELRNKCQDVCDRISCLILNAN